MEDKAGIIRKSNKTRRETAVQGTNDSSIVSKCSTSSCGYFNDSFLHYFVSKVSRRAPLIHRGYYIRAVAFDRLLRNFLKLYKHSKKQIISLGCGFDSSYFRLKAAQCLNDTVFCEIDFPELVKKKRLLIENTEALMGLVERSNEPSLSPHIEFSCLDYHLLGVDLTQLNTLEAALKMCGVDFESPTLLLSECVMTYMTRRCSTELVKWAAETFEEAVFGIYEQMNPDDAFGLFMQNHFHSIGSPLKCINAFPTLDAQRKRFLSTGWSWCEAMDMNTFYYHHVAADEQRRIENLETFDEYEELSLKYSHYFILTASTVPLRESLITSGAFVGENRQNPSIPHVMTVTRLPEHESVRRFGHASSLANGHFAVSSGGFGEIDGRHQRLTEITITDLNTFKSFHAPCLSDHVQCSRMHHTSVTCSDGSTFLIGGRQSPYFMCDQMLKLTFRVNSRRSSDYPQHKYLPEGETTDHPHHKHLPGGEIPDSRQHKHLSELKIQSNPQHKHLSKENLQQSEERSSNILYTELNSAQKSLTCNQHLNSGSFSKEKLADHESASSAEAEAETRLSKDFTKISSDSNFIEFFCDHDMHTEHNVSSSGDNLQEQGSSPAHVSRPHSVISCTFDIGQVDISVVCQKGAVPKERWRHAAVALVIDGKEKIFLHGGKTKTGEILGDCFLFDPGTNIWEQLVCTGDIPSPCHSHCVTHWSSCVILTGGLDASSVPGDTVYILNLSTCVWSKMDITGNLYSRYSHTAHLVPQDILLLVGGVNLHHPPPGLAVLNLRTKKVLEFALPNQDKSSLLMFHRHTSILQNREHIVVLGGGGNCFSFGTHLNRTPVTLNVGPCINAVE